jgi:branched-chain amino acid transport system permease protein
MLQQFINGIITGSLYALIAIGLTMVYGILRILHIAHAAVFVSGAYLGLIAYTYTQSLIFALFMAAVGCTILGWLIQRFLYTPLLTEARIVLQSAFLYSVRICSGFWEARIFMLLKSICGLTS